MDEYNQETAYHVDIIGRVTGIGFRFFAMNRAETYGRIKGWIRNIGHDHVEALCQGDDATLRKFLHDLSQGPAWSRVDEIKINEVPTSDMLANFHIK
jgi:acylphosphatase